LTEKVKNPLDRTHAIEGEKQLAITGGESLAGSGDIKNQKATESVPTPVARPNEHGALVPVTEFKINPNFCKNSIFEQKKNFW